MTATTRIAWYRPVKPIPVRRDYAWSLYWDSDQPHDKPHRCGCGGPPDCPDRSVHIAIAFNKREQMSFLENE